MALSLAGETLRHILHWWSWEKEIWCSLDQKGWVGVGGKGIWKHLYLPKLQHHYKKVLFSMDYGMAMKKHKRRLGSYLLG